MNQIPPHNVDAEEAVSGSLLIGGELSQANLSPKDFFTDGNAVIYDACTQLRKSGVSINQITVAQKLSEMGKLEVVGGPSYLSHLIAICPTSLDLPHYAEIVKRSSVSRELIKIGGEITELGYQNNPDLNNSLQKADDLILSVRKKTVSSALITPEDRANKMLERYEELRNSNAGVVKTGITQVDKCLGGGLYQGALYVLGARPGVGKTTFLQSVANYAADWGKVLFASGEMGEDELTHRDVAGLSKIPINRIRLGGYDEPTYNAIIDSIGTLSGRGIYFLDKTPLTTANIQQAALSMRLRYGLDLLVIDYLGLLDDAEGENQNLRLGHISRRLKYIARSLKIPVLVAHQLSRANEMRSGEDRRPRLSDLRESGHIEEDADAVMFIHRQSYYGGSDNTTEIIIAKQRQGEANKLAKVLFDKTTQSYKPLTVEPEGVQKEFDDRD